MDAGDLPACLALLRGHLAYPDDALAALLRAWRRLLREDSLVASVVEARRGGGSPVVAGFGASVFVSDAWMDAARRAHEPYLSMRTIRLELEGPSPILRPAAIRRDNGGSGLNVLVLHYGEERELTRDARAVVRRRMFDAFVEMHRGYRVKAILQEFWDEIDHEYVVRGWGRVLTDYASFFERRRQGLPPIGRRPHLVGMTREEAQADPGNLAAPLFIHVPPRLFFTRAEQQMLRAALSGQTDVELARWLALALPTVKSRWRGIYDRVGRVAPDLLPAAGSSEHRGSSRGREKRRRLLEYVRRHPEELRPGLCRRTSGVLPSY